MNNDDLVLLTEGTAVATVDARHGGRLASLRLQGRERLVTDPPADADPELAPLLWGCFPMAPWAGRLKDAIVPWSGARRALRPILGAHAIHGVVWQHAHAVNAISEREVELRCLLDEDDWPLGGSVRQRLLLAHGTLRWTLTVQAGARPMPAALGWHPWFARPGDADLALTVDADTVLETDAELLPTGRRRPAAHGEVLDGAALGSRRLDHVYVDPVAPAELAWPDLVLRIGWEGPITALVVHSPERGVCVEPQTAWPDAPRLAATGVEATGLVELDPGESLSATMVWQWTPA